MKTQTRHTTRRDRCGLSCCGTDGTRDAPDPRGESRDRQLEAESADEWWHRQELARRGH